MSTGNPKFDEPKKMPKIGDKINFSIGGRDLDGEVVELGTDKKVKIKWNDERFGWSEGWFPYGGGKYISPYPEY